MLEHRDRTETDHVVEDPTRHDLQWMDDDGTTGTGFEPPPATTPVATAEQPAAPWPVKTRRRFTWGQVLILLAGIASLVFGVGAVALAGLDGPVTEPVVHVFGYPHTPLLGLLEVGAGVLLVCAALVPGGRWVAGLIGAGAIAGGVLILAEYEWTQTELAAEKEFGWVVVAIGAAAYFGAMVPPKKTLTVAR